MLKNAKHADYVCYVQELRGAYGAGFRSGGGGMFGSLEGRLVGYLNLKPQSFLCLRVSASNKNDLCVPI